MKNWSIEHDSERGMITHHAAPRFCAYWTNGTAKSAVPFDVFWSDAGTGIDDSISLFDVQWTDPHPEGLALQALMHEAAKAVDEWIANRL